MYSIFVIVIFRIENVPRVNLSALKKKKRTPITFNYVICQHFTFNSNCCNICIFEKFFQSWYRYMHVEDWRNFVKIRNSETGNSWIFITNVIHEKNSFNSLVNTFYVLGTHLLISTIQLKDLYLIDLELLDSFQINSTLFRIVFVIINRQLLRNNLIYRCNFYFT